MTRASYGFLALSTFALASAAYAQTDRSTKAADVRQATTAKKQKVIHLSGMIGLEGKTLVSDNGHRIWNVVNPEALSTNQGRRVSVKGFAETATSQITVTVVRLNEERTTAKLDDVAFRR